MWLNSKSSWRLRMPNLELPLWPPDPVRAVHKIWMPPQPMARDENKISVSHATNYAGAGRPIVGGLVMISMSRAWWSFVLVSVSAVSNNNRSILLRNGKIFALMIRFDLWPLERAINKCAHHRERRLSGLIRVGLEKGLLHCFVRPEQDITHFRKRSNLIWRGH